MPELPEVEVTRQSFAQLIAGAVVTGVRLGLPLRWPLGCAPQALVGRQVVQVSRRGKYLLVELDSGLLLLHLGMSGSLAFTPGPARPPGKHDHFDLATTQGTLRLQDPRRFGAAVYADSLGSPQARKLLDKLGVEPLGEDFDARRFHAALRLRSTAIKQVLLAGEVVVGVGNIYASEALFAAGIRPTLAARRLSFPRALALHGAIRSVLAAAVRSGGSTLRDFSNAQGQSGYFQLQAEVYGRAGLPCRKCGGTIVRLVQGQRATYFCRVCQK
ncbi:MAG: bifunctional DNA-formamidopyrimidine glycosylase/DNA-(apurinic or apyrimidinic site) lyase [Burkholderiaceae bacterium]